MEGRGGMNEGGEKEDKQAQEKNAELRRGGLKEGPKTWQGYICKPQPVFFL